MKALSDDPANKAWWEVCVPCQLPLEHRQVGEWWATMDEVFHLD
jgi:L-rhamnose mutarotase